MSDITININVHLHSADDETNRLLREILAKEKNVMAEIDDLRTAFSQLNDITTQIGATQAAEAANLTQIGNNLTALLGGSLTPADVAAAQAQVAALTTVAASVKANADATAALATQGAANPVPVPPPAAPTPAVEPVAPTA
jgi:peptidoglycan hydrolase CwlO-like protein